MSLWKYGVEAFVTLFVIMDPPGAAPIFLALVADRDRKQQNRLALQASLVAFSVISVFALFGQFILRYLNISLLAMQGAGGLLLLLVSLELLTGKSSDPTASAGVNVALVPLGTPLLAGPGAIVATIIFVRRIQNVNEGLVLALAVIVVHLLLWLILRSSTVVMKVLRESGVTLVARIAGLLLSAIAVQMIADAVRAFIKAG
jgi:multiple antibiotic resistance protein